MIERAIVQEVVTDRDGHAVTRESLRPDEVRAFAKRVRQWHIGGDEVCVRCKDTRAVFIRNHEALCASCRSTVQFMEWGDPIESRLFTGAQDADNLVGHAIVFNKRSVDLGGFVEIVKPEAVNRTLQDKHADVRALWSHDGNVLLGRQSAGTLRISKDSIGLAIAIDPPQWASNYVETVQRSDVSGMSFGFSTLGDEWHMEDGTPIRELLDVRILEVSPTGFPAYPDTDIRVGKMLASRMLEWQPSVSMRDRMVRAGVR